MNSLPRWYVPKGLAKPAHIRLTDGQTLHDDQGPDGLGGGTMYGGSFTPGEAGWLKTPGGWWINLRDVAPQTLAPWVLRQSRSACRLCGQPASAERDVAA